MSNVYNIITIVLTEDQPQPAFLILFIILLQLYAQALGEVNSFSVSTDRILPFGSKSPINRWPWKKKKK